MQSIPGGSASKVTMEGLHVSNSFPSIYHDGGGEVEVSTIKSSQFDLQIGMGEETGKKFSRNRAVKKVVLIGTPTLSSIYEVSTWMVDRQLLTSSFSPFFFCVEL